MIFFCHIKYIMLFKKTAYWWCFESSAEIKNLTLILDKNVQPLQILYSWKWINSSQTGGWTPNKAQLSRSSAIPKHKKIKKKEMHLLNFWVHLHLTHLPRGPRKPVAWHSSINTMAPYCSARSQIPVKGATSPSMEKTPSVTTRRIRDDWGGQNRDLYWLDHSLINTVTLPDPVTGVIWGNRKGCGEHLSLLLTCLISISFSSKCTHNKLCNAHTWRSGSKSGLALVAPHDTGKVNYV